METRLPILTDGRAEERLSPVRDKPTHRRMDGQNHLALARRNGGSHARMTPDRRRGIRYCGISPSFSILSRRGRERLCSACRGTDFLERLTKRVAVMQNGLVGHVAALNAAPGPISCPYLPDIQIHAMLIH
jgi:hypothetical protein